MADWDDLAWVKKSGNERRKKDKGKPRCSRCGGYGRGKDGFALSRKTKVPGGKIYLHGWCHSMVLKAGGHEKCEHPECIDSIREKYGYARIGT